MRNASDWVRSRRLQGAFEAGVARRTPLQNEQSLGRTLQFPLEPWLASFCMQPLARTKAS
jgi:hypothetical protein